MIQAYVAHNYRTRIDSVYYTGVRILIASLPLRVSQGAVYIQRRGRDRHHVLLGLGGQGKQNYTRLHTILGAN